MQVQEEMSVQSIDSIYHIDYDYITLTIATDAQPAQICTYTVYVINSQYGLFVSSINEESVYRRMINTLYENKILSEERYETAIASTYSLPNDAAKGNELLSKQTTNIRSALVETTVIAEYNIKVPSSGRLTVEGFVYWTDTEGDRIAARSVCVVIMDDDSSSDEVIGAVWTDSTGKFSYTFTNQTSGENGYDIYMKLYPQSETVRVQSDSGDYALSTAALGKVHNNVTTQILNQSVTFTASQATNAFQIHQAICAAETYANAQLDEPMWGISISYPAGENAGYEIGCSRIYLTENAFSSWDVIMHEYGHHVAYYNEIAVSDGGQHAYIEDLILRYGKLKGCRLAWEEGWATYFGLSAQHMTYVKNLGIPSVGNAAYESFYSGGATFNVENTEAVGEGNEVAIAAALWDFSDNSAVSGSAAEWFDNISLGFAIVFNKTIASGATNFSQFMNYMYNNVLTRTSSAYQNIGGILEELRIAAYDLTCDQTVLEFCFHIAHESRDIKEKIDRNEYEYYIEICNPATMGVRHLIPIGTAPGNLTTMWECLESGVVDDIAANLPNGFYWCVRAVSTTYPNTGPYYSKFYFSSVELK